MEDWKYLMVNTKGVFKTQSNIYDGAFFCKNSYSFVRNCRGGANFWGKNLQVHLIIIRE